MIADWMTIIEGLLFIVDMNHGHQEPRSLLDLDLVSQGTDQAVPLGR